MAKNVPKDGVRANFTEREVRMRAAVTGVSGVFLWFVWSGDGSALGRFLRGPH